jgi:ABC-type nickel/cobalt efflux system permease component RcnA
MRGALLVDWMIAVLAVSLLVMLGTWLITRRLRHELDVAESALKVTDRDAAVPKLHLPILGEEVEQGISDLVRKQASLMEGAAEKPALSAQ